MEIKVNKITPEIHAAYDPEGTFLGMLNEYEFNDLRVQIKKAQAVGYYFIKPSGERFNMDKNGRSSDWEDGFFSMYGDQLMELI